MRWNKSRLYVHSPKIPEVYNSSPLIKHRIQKGKQLSIHFSGANWLVKLRGCISFPIFCFRCLDVHITTHPLFWRVFEVLSRFNILNLRMILWGFILWPCSVQLNQKRDWNGITLKRLVFLLYIVLSYWDYIMAFHYITFDIMRYYSFLTYYIWFILHCRSY